VSLEPSRKNTGGSPMERAVTPAVHPDEWCQTRDAAKLHPIGPAFQALRQREDFDYTSPYIEYYRSQRELLVIAPIQ